MYLPFSFTTTQGKISATGGTEATFTSGGIEYKSHTFANWIGTGSFSVISGITSEAKILIVGAGGGSGGYDFSTPDYYPAGGGGGQVIASSSVSLTGGETYEIVVGIGGTNSSGTGAGTNGNLSYIVGPAISSSAYGGGGGGAVNGNGRDGGCGGGAGVNKTTGTSPGTAIHGAFGNNGGQETACSEPYPATNRGGAGGGAGGAGSNNNPGAGFETTIRNGTTEYVAHGGAPGIPGTICSYSSLPTGWSTAIAGKGGSLTDGQGQPGIVIITYPNPQ